MQRILHTPDGVRDIYGNECREKYRLMNHFNQIFEDYHYVPIQTPTFEFLDVFSSEMGSVPSHELFRFFDRGGHTLALRPDFTPSIARTVSMYFEGEERPLRLCYQGSTFVNNTELQGRLKESTQMGVEMIGEPSEHADAEIIALTIDCLKKAGLEEFQVSIGEVNFFKSLVNDGSLDESQIENIRHLISVKNFYAVEDLLEGSGMSSRRIKALVKLPQLFGGVEILDEAGHLAVNKACREAIDRLRAIYALLEDREMSKYVSFDFGALSQYRYYTGIIFSAFSYGSGDAIAKGGRYDTLLGHYGKSEAAVGVGFSMDQLMNIISYHKRKEKF